MRRSQLGLIMMVLGLVLVVVGLVSVTSSEGDSSSQAFITTTTANATTSTSTTSTSTSTTSTSTTSTSTVAPETAGEFLSELNNAFESADGDYLLARLGGAVIDRYGTEQCTTYLAQILPQAQGLSMRDELGVGAWDYSTDGQVTSLSDVTTVEVDRDVDGEVSINELHWQRVDGKFTWFTDCGEPLAAS